MILKEKFHNAYVADSYSKQYENYQKIADEWALEFAIYLEASEKDEELKKEIKHSFEMFKRDYKATKL